MKGLLLKDPIAFGCIEPSLSEEINKCHWSPQGETFLSSDEFHIDLEPATGLSTAQVDWLHNKEDSVNLLKFDRLNTCEFCCQVHPNRTETVLEIREKQCYLLSYFRKELIPGEQMISGFVLLFKLGSLPLKAILHILVTSLWCGRLIFCGLD